VGSEFHEYAGTFNYCICFLVNIGSGWHIIDDAHACLGSIFFNNREDKRKTAAADGR